MPCYIVQTTSIVFQPKFKKILLDALTRSKIRFWDYSSRELIVKDKNGMAFSIMWDEGVLKVDARRVKELQPLINKVKQEYSKQVLLFVAKKKKWKMQGKGNNTFMIQR